MSLVEISKIEVPKPRQRVDRKNVEVLSESLRTEGQLQSIGLRHNPAKPGHYQLVWGRHCLEAARQIGWTEIEARIIEVTPEQGEATSVESRSCSRVTKADQPDADQVPEPEAVLLPFVDLGAAKSIIPSQPVRQLSPLISSPSMNSQS